MMFVLLCRRSLRSSAVCAVVLVQLEVYAPLVLFLLMYA
jgi:hypothetical protein